MGRTSVNGHRESVPPWSRQCKRKNKNRKLSLYRMFYTHLECTVLRFCRCSHSILVNDCPQSFFVTAKRTQIYLIKTFYCDVVTLSVRLRRNIEYDKGM